MILFIADIHIKLGQKNVPKDWAKNRYRLFFEQVNQAALDCSLIILGGDIFDRVPTVEELELYFEFVGGLRVPTIIFDGNHEATKKYKTFFTNLKKVTNDINSECEIIDETWSEGRFSILPYCDLHKKGSIEELDSSLPLFTHVRGEIPPHVKPEVDLERFAPFPIVFAGDLHAHSNCQKNIVYPGSPVTTSFHRQVVETGYIIIDEADWSWEWSAFDLPQLIRKTVKSEDEMVATDFHHTIYEIEGDMQELASIKNSDLLDKKVVKRSTETTLLLTPEMDIRQELMEYLLYIIELPEEKATQILGVFNDYAPSVDTE